MQYGFMMEKHFRLILLSLVVSGSLIFALPQSEIDACNTFKASMSPDPGWIGTNPCAWVAEFKVITCEIVDTVEHVTTISLGGSALSLEIGDWIINVPYLSTLYVSNVTFSKPISPQIALLPRLRVFNILFSKNVQLPVIPSNTFSPLSELGVLNSDLAGEIPDLRAFPNLTRLDLASTLIDGTIPYLGDSKVLSFINIYSNPGVHGTIPKELVQLSQLRNLYLYDNNLTGTIPPELGQLSLLVQLYLNDNKLNGTIPRELALGFLSNQYLQNNQLTGTIPAEYGSMAYLYNFDVSGNKLTGTIPTAIKDAPYLSLFNVSNNPLSGCYNVSFLRGEQVDCDVSNTNLCCIPTDPQCFTTTNKCVPCVLPAPSPNATCQVNEKNEAVWVIEGNLVLTPGVSIDNIIVNGNLTISGDLSVSNGVIVVKGCPNINGTASLSVTLTPAEITALTQSGQLERTLLIFDIACDTSNLDFKSITIDADVGDSNCAVLRVSQQTKPGLISIIVVQDTSACKSTTNGPSAPSLPDWGIAVIVVGAVLVAGAVILIAVLVTNKQKKNESRAMTHKLSTGTRNYPGF